MAKVPPPPRGKGEPPAPLATLGNLDNPEPGPLKPLNFKVPDQFRRECKIYAALRGMTMVEVLHAAYSALRREDEDQERLDTDLIVRRSTPE